MFNVAFEVLALIPRRLRYGEIFSFCRFQCKPQQLKPWNDVFEAPCKRHFHRSGILSVIRKIVVVDLIRAERFAIALLKKRSVIGASCILAPIERQAADVQRYLSTHDRPLHSLC